MRDLQDPVLPEALSKRISALSPAKRALWRQRAAITRDTSPYDRLEPDPSAALTLSFAQERLWVLHQMDPSGFAYNEFQAYKVYGSLDFALFDRSIDAIIQRHDVLRTGFSMIDGRLVATLHSVKPFTSEIIDLRGEEPHEAQTLESLCRSESRRPFDLTAPPPFLRATLVRLDSESAILLTLHHIVTDGWSTGILLQEFRRCYEELRTGLPAQLAPLSIQHTDFARWQRGRLDTPELRSQRQFWREKLKDAPVLDLQTDRPRSTEISMDGRRCGFVVTAAVTGRLRAIAQSTGTSLYMVLIAAFALQLARLSGQKDVVIGSPTSGRTAPELEAQIGCFFELLALRIDVSLDERFLDLLTRVRRIALEALENQDVPFEVVIDDVEPARAPGVTPIFQVAFFWQNFPNLQEDPSGLHLDPITVPIESAKFDLSLIMREDADALAGSLEFRTAIFDQATALRMIDQFLNIVEEISTAPEICLREVSLLSPDARRMLLKDWNRTDRDFGSDQRFPTLFEAKVRECSRDIAVRAPDGVLTYDDLNCRANALARQLMRAGIGKDQLVPIHCKRTLNLVVAILAVAKAGGGYLPLDSRMPRIRIERILAEVQPRVTLTETGLDPPWLRDITETWVSTDWNTPDVETGRNLDLAAAADSLAYAIYTSGSTGGPKGVLVEHRALTNVLMSIGQDLGDCARTRLLALTTISFDIASLELLLPLVHGGTLELLGEEICGDAARLAAELDKTTGPHIVQATPATWQTLLSAGWAGQSDLTILCGGEAMSPELADALFCRSGCLYNMYGPTETTIWSLMTRIELPRSPITLGRPIANTQAYVLDDSLRPIPVGVVGDLFIGGHGVARGYINRDDLTASQFLPDPFRGDAARIYRTGDLASFRPDGSIKFHGRSDSLIKMRGWRIEPTEVEAALAEHADVAMSVVTVDPTTQSLRAHVVPIAGRNPHPRELRKLLAQRLPHYMVPGLIGIVDRLPTTSNGKIDRSSLPPIEAAPGDDDESPPVSDVVEDVVASLFARALSKPAVSLSASFFELGGHSILAAQLSASMGETFGRTVSIREIFEASSVRSLSDLVRRRVAQNNPRQSHRIARRPGPRTMLLGRAQQHLWTLYRAWPESPHQNVTRAVQIDGVFDADALQRNIDLLVARHPILGRAFDDTDGIVNQSGPYTGAQLAMLDIADVEDRDESSSSLIWSFASLPFSLKVEAPFRVLLLRLSARRHVLAMSVHHIVCDGWSLALIWRDLRSLFEGRAMSDLPVDYYDHVTWLESQAAEVDLAADRTFWRRELAGGRPPSGSLFPRHGGLPSFKYITSTFELDETRVAALRDASIRLTASPFICFLTALAHALGRVGNEVAIATIVANRNRPETQDLVGPFANTVVVRVAVSPDASLEDLLPVVRSKMLEASAHQELPFEALIDEIELRTSGGRPEVLIISQDIAIEPMNRGVLEVRDIEIVDPAPSAKLDNVEVTMSAFPLIIFIDKVNGRLRIKMMRSVDLMNSDRVIAVLRHFRESIRLFLSVEREL
ncbi:amino acid adenylation domain-containing protein [Mesorhizobium sp. M0772]|uniref:amino acid adenylation domain-containing protein n=1 Tax=Mesorhizobium sp. M0772 TaxID=2956998 RepID=UPI0033395F8C